MFEKSILVYYMNYDGLSRKETFDMIHSIQNYIENQFKKDIDNNTLDIIIVPVQNQPTKIELLNAKYPDWEQFQNDIETLKEKIYENNG